MLPGQERQPESLHEATGLIAKGQMDTTLDEALLRSWHHRDSEQRGTALDATRGVSGAREGSPGRRARSKRELEEWKLKMREKELAEERTHDRQRQRNTRSGVRSATADGKSYPPGQRFRESSKRGNFTEPEGGFATRSVREVAVDDEPLPGRGEALALPGVPVGSGKAAGLRKWARGGDVGAAAP